ncbi:MAG: DNA gyrase subunit A [Candidatus Kerfeldbacteria bacterium]
MPAKKRPTAKKKPAVKKAAKKAPAKKAPVQKAAPAPAPEAKPQEMKRAVTDVEVRDIGKVGDQPIVEEMSASYIDYAMSVIVTRALPDVRDGMKPVHRRILYAMWGIGLKSSAKFRKSATVVGEVLGKYHPHGDTAVYDSLVRMAQDFSLRYMLVNGQGNFGSMDGDSAAAMRYTECKLRKIAEELLLDIDKDTVDFMPNYDGVHKEPTVLPAKIPGLLLNGSVGIAVGMATNIPPHNLSELCDAISALADNPDMTTDDLMEHVTGPDFPTGGVIFNVEDIKHAYATGKGPIVTRGRAEIVEGRGGFEIIVTEIPYLVNKASLIEKMADLVRDKKLEGIKDLRDESSKDGVRIVIELKKSAFPQKVLNRLYQLTQLQTTFHVNMLALVDGIQPRVLTLKMVLEEFLKHRELVVKRRTQFDLTKAEDRAHILDGLVIALEKIDEVIKTIKKSKDRDDAQKNLMKRFKMTDRQAVAILEMKLQALTNLDQLKVEEELKLKKDEIKEYKRILSSRKNILSVVKDEVTEMKKAYGDERRTQVMPNPIGKFSQEDLIPKEDTVMMITKDGYIKRLPPDTFKKQNRGGKGVIGLTTKEEDLVEDMFITNTHADILFFTTKGRVFQLKAYEVPEASRTAKGQALVNFLQLAPDEALTATLSLSDLSKYKYLVMVTKKGVMKKTDISDFANVRRSGLIAIKLKADDQLFWVKPSTGTDRIMLISDNGQAIRFDEKDVRPMGRAASGVRGLKLKADGTIAGMGTVPKDAGKETQLVVIMEHGYGKRTAINQYKVQHRGGSGVKTANVTDKTGTIVSAFIVSTTENEGDIVIVSQKGQVIRLPLKSVNILGRATQGVRLMRFKQKGDAVASVTII